MFSWKTQFKEVWNENKSDLSVSVSVSKKKAAHAWKIAVKEDADLFAAAAGPCDADPETVASYRAELKGICGGLAFVTILLRHHKLRMPDDVSLTMYCDNESAVNRVQEWKPTLQQNSTWSSRSDTSSRWMMWTLPQNMSGTPRQRLHVWWTAISGADQCGLRWTCRKFPAGTTVRSEAKFRSLLLRLCCETASRSCQTRQLDEVEPAALIPPCHIGNWHVDLWYGRYADWCMAFCCTWIDEHDMFLSDERRAPKNAHNNSPGNECNTLLLRFDPPMPMHPPISSERSLTKGWLLEFIAAALTEPCRWERMRKEKCY